MNQTKEHLPENPFKPEFESDFETFHQQYSKILKKSQSNHVDGQLLISCQSLLEQVIQNRGMGDFESLIQDLKKLDLDIMTVLNKNLDDKELICTEAKAPVSDDNINAIESIIIGFQDKWNLCGDVPPRQKPAIESKFEAAIESLHKQYDLYHQHEMEQNLILKEKICLEAEEVSLSKDWKVSGDKLIDLEKKWKKTGPVPGNISKSIWDRFQLAINTHYQNRNEYFSQLEHLKVQNLQLKEKFCEEAEVICESDDWPDAEDKLSQLEQDWKKVGAVPMGDSDAIWKRFQAAIDRFYLRRTQYFEEHQEELVSNLKKKEELCVNAEALTNPENWKKAETEINKLQEEWKTIGHVQMNLKDDIWKRFRLALNTFYNNRKIYFKSRENEWQSLLDKKELLCVEIESIYESDEWDKTETRIKELQTEWKNIGYVPNEMSDAIWKRFQLGANSFFQRRNEFRDQQKLENLAQKEDLCRQAEALIESTDWKETAETYKELQSKWKKIGFIPREKSDMVWKRFRSAADTFFNNREKYYDELNPEWRENLKLKEALCKKAEKLRYTKYFDTTEAKFKSLQEKWDEVGDLPDEISEAIKSRFTSSLNIFEKRLKVYREETEKGFYKNLEIKEELCKQVEELSLTGDISKSMDAAKELQKKWKETGPVPWKFSDKIWGRFHDTCDRIFRVGRAEMQTKHLEWKKNLSNVIFTRKEQRERLLDSIYRDEHYLENISKPNQYGQDDWKQKLLEITKGDKKAEVEERINSKKLRLEKLDKSIKDMEKKSK